MNINSLLNKTIDFTTKRVAELIGLLLIFLSILLLISLISYSPEDPNFIFPENTEIKNILGHRGSFISDIFFQSIGLISFLISLTIFFTGISLFRKKKFLIIFENLFYTVIYSLFGSLFFATYHSNSYWLPINGNGGFVGKFLENTFFSSLINLNEKISYYILFLISLIVFLLSVNFSIKFFFNLIKNFFILAKNQKNNNQEINIDYKADITQEDILVQEDLPFNKSTHEQKKANKKFKLPSIDFLKSPSQKERERNQTEDKLDESLLEKILLDFGVEGKIKKINRGPVVTLNEFEPAAGVKVSKIINLSEDIARNTSSESARISTIP